MLNKIYSKFKFKYYKNFKMNIRHPSYPDTILFSASLETAIEKAKSLLAEQ
jgi:hypothetical protein